MRTVRKSVFETNSSSMHCITFCNEDLGDDGKLAERTTDEYPVPNEDGVLEIEVTRYWTCSDQCVTSNLRDIIEYFCVLADGSGNDHKGAQELLRKQYEAAGLTPPKDFYLYVVDMDGNRVSYEKGNFVAPEYRYLYEEQRYEYMFDVWCGTDQKVVDFINDELGVKVTPAIYASVDLTVEQFLKLRAAFPDFRQSDTQLPLGELAVLAHGAGVACNDLTGESLADALEYLDSAEIGQFGDRYQYYDLFKYRLTLNFRHSFVGTQMSTISYLRLKIKRLMTNLFGIKFNVRRKTIKDAVFTNMTFVLADFSETQLFGVVFKNCNFAHCTFDGSSMSRVAFNGCTHTSCRFNDSIMDTVEFNYSSCYDCNFNGVLGGGSFKSNRATFTKCFMPNVKMPLSEFKFSMFEKCQMSGSDFTNMKAVFTLFSDCDLSQTDLSRSAIFDSRFDQCDLPKDTFGLTTLANTAIT